MRKLLFQGLLCTFALLAFGMISLSVAGTAYAQDAGLPVAIEGSELFIGLIETNLIWLIPAAVAGVVIYKLKF